VGASRPQRGLRQRVLPAGEKTHSRLNAGTGKKARNPTTIELKEAIIAHGPILATVQATPLFAAYSGRVFQEITPGKPNHAFWKGWIEYQLKS